MFTPISHHFRRAPPIILISTPVLSLPLPAPISESRSGNVRPSSFDSFSCAKTQRWSSSSSWSSGSCEESKLMAGGGLTCTGQHWGSPNGRRGYCEAVRQPLWVGRQTNSYPFGEIGGKTLTGLWKCKCQVAKEPQDFCCSKHKWVFFWSIFSDGSSQVLNSDSKEVKLPEEFSVRPCEGAGTEGKRPTPLLWNCQTGSAGKVRVRQVN